MDELGCPDPAAVVQRMLSTRNCWASSCTSTLWAVIVAIAMVFASSL